MPAWYYAAFHWLEELGYSWAAADQLYRRHPPHFDDTGQMLVAGLRTQFRLKPLVLPDLDQWRDSHER